MTGKWMIFAINFTLDIQPRETILMNRISKETNLVSYLGYRNRLSFFQLFGVLNSFYFTHVLFHLLQVLHIFSQFLAVMFSFHDVLRVLDDVILVVRDETAVTNVNLNC